MEEDEEQCLRRKVSVACCRGGESEFETLIRHSHYPLHALPLRSQESVPPNSFLAHDLLLKGRHA